LDKPGGRGARLEEELSNGVRAKGEQAGVSRGTPVVRTNEQKESLTLMASR
jgi:hypothetical protein